MDREPRGYQRWIWTELIGFDNRHPDLGVHEYLATTGFVPDAVCLLLSHVDFVLLHPGMATETALEKDFCAREGHDRNQQRQRQIWTNWQLRALVDALHAQGVAVYVTVFAGVFGNRHHREWAADHPEVRAPYPSLRRLGSINPLRRLADGSFYEDLFLAKLLGVMEDYGFDGWHGADGYGPLSGPLYEVDLSDDMVDQFLAWGGDLPASVERSCGLDDDALHRRREWLWRHRRREWITFYAERWAAFWQKMVAGLHAHNRKAVINSAWGRAPFESLYRYGIDYRRIANTGVDGIVVETVAAALSIDERCGDAERHYDFLSMLMLIKACVPETPLIFLHNVHDVVEQWDALRHAPTTLEKEIHSLANACHTGSDGRQRRCVNGLLACLGDAIGPAEWRWLRERWEAAFAVLPRRFCGATLVWSDTAMYAQVDDFSAHRTWFAHRLLFHLMAHGAPVQSTVRIESVQAVEGPLLVLNPHLLTAAERACLPAARRGPLIAIGPDLDGLPVADLLLVDGDGPRPMRCGVYGWQGTADVSLDAEPEIPFPNDVLGLIDPRGYWDHLVCHPVSRRFLLACSRIIQDVAGGVRVLSHQDAVTAMLAEIGEGLWQVTVKNKTHVYAKPKLDLGRPIASVKARSEFPAVTLVPDGSTITVKVPPTGIVVLDVAMGR